MKGGMLVLVIALSLVMLSCDPTTSPIPDSQPDRVTGFDCPADTRACPDGSVVGRDGPNCDFEICPTPGTDLGGAVHDTPTMSCDEAWSFKEYVAFGTTCVDIGYTCEGGEKKFTDSCGCGCEPDADCNDANRFYESRSVTFCNEVDLICPQGQEAFFDSCGCGCVPKQIDVIEQGAIQCRDIDRFVTSCEQRALPVCGVEFNSQVRRNYPNSCFACLDQNVDYYVAGNC